MVSMPKSGLIVSQYFLIATLHQLMNKVTGPLTFLPLGPVYFSLI